MTDHYEEYQELKVVTKYKFIKTTCDRCNEEIPSEGAYEDHIFDLEFTKGTSWPDGSGDKKGWEVKDLCDKCAEWLKGVLTESGVSISEIDESW